MHDLGTLSFCASQVSRGKADIWKRQKSFFMWCQRTLSCFTGKWEHVNTTDMSSCSCAGVSHSLSISMPTPKAMCQDTWHLTAPFIFYFCSAQISIKFWIEVAVKVEGQSEKLHNHCLGRHLISSFLNNFPINHSLQSTHHTGPTCADLELKNYNVSKICSRFHRPTSCHCVSQWSRLTVEVWRFPGPWAVHVPRRWGWTRPWRNMMGWVTGLSMGVWHVQGDGGDRSDDWEDPGFWPLNAAKKQTGMSCLKLTAEHTLPNCTQGQAPQDQVRSCINTGILSHLPWNLFEYLQTCSRLLRCFFPFLHGGKFLTLYLDVDFVPIFRCGLGQSCLQFVVSMSSDLVTGLVTSLPEGCLGWLHEELISFWSKEKSSKPAKVVYCPCQFQMNYW